MATTVAQAIAERELSNPATDGITNLRFTNPTGHLLGPTLPPATGANVLRGEFKHGGLDLYCCSHDDSSGSSACGDSTVPVPVPRVNVEKKKPEKQNEKKGKKQKKKKKNQLHSLMLKRCVVYRNTYNTGRILWESRQFLYYNNVVYRWRYGFESVLMIDSSFEECQKKSYHSYIFFGKTRDKDHCGVFEFDYKHGMLYKHFAKLELSDDKLLWKGSCIGDDELEMNFFQNLDPSLCEEKKKEKKEEKKEEKEEKKKEELVERVKDIRIGLKQTMGKVAYIPGSSVKLAHLLHTVIKTGGNKDFTRDFLDRYKGIRRFSTAPAPSVHGSVSGNPKKEWMLTGDPKKDDAVCTSHRYDRAPDIFLFKVLHRKEALQKYKHIISADDQYRSWQEVESACKDDPEGLALKLAENGAVSAALEVADSAGLSIDLWRELQGRQLVKLLTGDPLNGGGPAEASRFLSSLRDSDDALPVAMGAMQPLPNQISKQLLVCFFLKRKDSNLSDAEVSRLNSWALGLRVLSALPLPWQQRCSSLHEHPQLIFEVLLMRKQVESSSLAIGMRSTRSFHSMSKPLLSKDSEKVPLLSSSRPLAKARMCFLLLSTIKRVIR